MKRKKMELMIAIIVLISVAITIIMVRREAHQVAKANEEAESDVVVAEAVIKGDDQNESTVDLDSEDADQDFDRMAGETSSYDIEDISPSGKIFSPEAAETDLSVLNGTYGFTWSTNGITDESINCTLYAVERYTNDAISSMQAGDSIECGNEVSLVYEIFNYGTFVDIGTANGSFTLSKEGDGYWYYYGDDDQYHYIELGTKQLIFSESFYVIDSRSLESIEHDGATGISVLKHTECEGPFMATVEIKQNVVQSVKLNFVP